MPWGAMTTILFHVHVGVLDMDMTTPHFDLESNRMSKPSWCCLFVYVLDGIYQARVTYHLAWCTGTSTLA